MGISESQIRSDSAAVPNGMRKSPDMSPRRLSDISPQLRQLNSLVVDEEIKEELKSSKSVEDINSVSIEERILRITGYYGYQPWGANQTEEQSREKLDLKADVRGGGTCVARATGSEQAGRLENLRCCVRVIGVHLQHALCGVAVVICMCASWSASTQLAQVTLRKVNAPLALTWFCTCWTCLLFPLYCMGQFCCSWAEPHARPRPRQLLRDCCQFLGDEGLSARVLLSRVTPFCVLWTLTHYLYLQGLRRIPATDASALFCCSRAFSFLLSWVVLRERFLGVRGLPALETHYSVLKATGSMKGKVLLLVRESITTIVAAILAIAGIVMMTYADGFHSDSVIGISLVVGSASTASMYKVLFRLVLGSAKLGEALLYLTVLGGANVLFVTVVPLTLLLSGAEGSGAPADLPWPQLCGIAALLLVFNFLLNFGVLVTLPTLVSLGVVLSVPVNAVIDRCSGDIQFNSVRLIAVSIICLGFLLLLLPEDWDRCLLHLRSALHRHDQPPEGARDTHAETLHIVAMEARHCNANPTT